MTEKNADIKLGDVWRFPYLWKREERLGDTEGRKNRPVVMVLLIQNDKGQQEAMLVPVTSQPQNDSPFAVPVPDIEKKRAGLDIHMDLWVVTDEHNIDTPRQSYYFEPAGRIGAFSTAFTKTLQARKIAAIQARKSSSVRRNDQ